MVEVDRDLARELELYYENDSALYRRVEAWHKNFLTKMSKGKYSHQLAVKGIADNFVPEVISSYNRNVVRLPPVDKQTKHFIAERFVSSFENEVRLGNLR